MKKQSSNHLRFALCLNNQDYLASLDIGKLYRVIPDKDAAAHGYIRVVDESGEDYAYAADRFFPIELPEAVELTLMVASEQMVA